MAKKSTNRLDSLWPGSSADGHTSAMPDVREFAKQLEQNIEPMLKNAASAIAEHPRVSLTAAATIGALLGWFIKRK
jgi:ElaB/YqjD/DUF883 family membrane-anchored ribosome-binding protein